MRQYLCSQLKCRSASAVITRKPRLIATSAPMSVQAEVLLPPVHVVRAYTSMNLPSALPSGSTAQRVEERLETKAMSCDIWLTGGLTPAWMACITSLACLARTTLS